MTTDTAIPHATTAWSTTWGVVGGPITAAVIETGAAAIAARHQLRLHRPGPQAPLQLTDPAGGVLLTVRWRPATPTRPDTLGHVLPDQPCLQVLIDAHPAARPRPRTCTPLHERTRRSDLAELREITASMPLLTRHATPDANLSGWAVIVRDHYVENTLALLLAIQRCGVPPQWISHWPRATRPTTATASTPP
ncbi:hypothetical protein ACWEJ6_43275 [Nonomuraea sp. NPDC004702]